MEPFEVGKTYYNGYGAPCYVTREVEEGQLKVALVEDGKVRGELWGTWDSCTGKWEGQGIDDLFGERMRLYPRLYPQKDDNERMFKHDEEGALRDRKAKIERAVNEHRPLCPHDSFPDRPVAAALMLSPDLKPTSHLIDPAFALAAEENNK